MAGSKQEQFPKELYSPSAKEVTLVKVPRMNFLVIEGKGNPAKSKEFQEAIGALYGTAYTMRFMFEKGHPIRAAAIGPLEGLFWTGRRAGRFRMDYKARELHWKLMLVQPRKVTKKAVDAAVGKLREKKDQALLSRLRFESFSEGAAVQTMHLGPYSEEMPTIGRLLSFATERGFEVLGPHHEIYLSDPHRTKPEKLKTVVRYAVSRKPRGHGVPAR